MNHPIPASSQEIVELCSQPIDGELVASAIAGVIQLAHSQGRSLEDLKAEVLMEDSLLNAEQRYWLSNIVSQAWQGLLYPQDRF